MDRERTEQLGLITEAALDLQRLIEGLGPSRQARQALDALELAVMWARRHLELEPQRDLMALFEEGAAWPEEEPPAAA